MGYEQLKEQARQFIDIVSQIEVENAAAIRSKQSLESTIQSLMEENAQNREAMDIATHAI